MKAECFSLKILTGFLSKISTDFYLKISAFRIQIYINALYQKKL